MPSSEQRPEDLRPPVRRPGPLRRIGFRAALVLFAVVWLGFGFGVIDLVSGFTAPGYEDPLDISVLSASYGALAGIVLPVALLSQLRAPHRRAAALQQLLATAAAFALAGVLALDPLSAVSVGTLVGMTAVLVALHPARPPLLPSPRGLHRPLLALAVLGAVPWAVHALATAAAGRAGLPPDDMAARPQAGGWAGATAAALCVVLLALLAATRTPGRRVPLWSAALTSAVVGGASWLHPSSPGSVGLVGGALAVAWAAALVVAGSVLPRDGTGGPPARR